VNPETQSTQRAALAVLRHNADGPFDGLPRTAGWGYPEPYTRDLLIAGLGIMASGQDDLMRSLRRVFQTLARNQSPHGQIPSMVHDVENRGASDTTPLFLLLLGMYRNFTGEQHFLEEAGARALQWMDYQSPDDRELIGQQPTSDWRDEHWVLGHGLFVNALAHGYLKILGLPLRAEALRATANDEERGFAVPGQPSYALWSYKVYRDDRCDVLGNSLAILTGLASPGRAREILDWIESRCDGLRSRAELAVDLPPCYFPFIQPSSPDWHDRYGLYNLPGNYHNGGIWPFVCGFHIAALVAAGAQGLAEARLRALSELVRRVGDGSPVPSGSWGFNEWFRAQDGAPSGQYWQTWSASMYLYAAACVEEGRALYF
jgi:hypothetical protein